MTLTLSASGCGTTRPGAVLQQSIASCYDRVIQATLLRPVDAGSVQAKETLSIDALVGDVLARNPSLEQMTGAWQAASARYPQVRALDDPMVGAMFAPASFGSSAVDSGYRIELSQKLPFPGKLRLRGQAALAEAGAAVNDIEDMRAQLIEAAKVAFYQYYLVERALTVNEESVRLLKEIRQTADSRYKAGLVPQQDILQADVELGRQLERELTLNRMRSVAIARINTLRNVRPDDALASAPAEIKVSTNLPSAESLRRFALAQRADLKALENRIASEQAGLALAHKEFFPDVEITGAYDTIMGNGPARDLAPQVGVRMNLPIRLDRRHAAVAEAHAKLAQKRADLAARASQIQFQVQEAYEQTLESMRILALYDKTILPAARENVKAAQAAYTTGKTPFLSVIESQRSLATLRDRYFEATAEQASRLATLERTIGGSIATMTTPTATK